jgi:hypothetical protein
MVADASHHLFSDLAASSIPTYLSNRQGHGFNATNPFAMCSGASNCPSNGAAADGTLPFTTGTGPSNYDLSTPNNAFWTEVDNFISRANSLGIVVVLDPMPWGAGFAPTYRNNGQTKVFNFGVYLGTRCKGFPNLIWHLGQDFDANTFPAASDLALMAQLMAGIASTDPNHLQTVQLNYFKSYSTQGNSSNATYAADLTANFLYTYYETYAETLAAYNASPALPIFLGESNYETANNTNMLPSGATAQVLRYQMWWTMTSGAAGHEWGNEHVSHFDSSWTTNLDTTATTQVKYLTSLFGQYPWWNLAPDQTHQVVTAGFGTSNPNNENLTTATYATAAWSSNDSLAIAYTPVSTTLHVNMAMFSKSSVSAFWYDPTTGTSSTVSGSPFANSGAMNFTTPGTAHSDGTHDWVLVLH